MVLCFSPMAKSSGMTKYNMKEENFIDQFIPESAQTLTWEEYENDIFYQYGKDFVISITMKKNETKKDDIAMGSMTMTKIIELKEGSNIGDDKIKINIILEKLRTLESGLCYKIISDVETIDKIKHFSLIMMDHLTKTSDQYVTGKVTLDLKSNFFPNDCFFQENCT